MKSSTGEYYVGLDHVRAFAAFMVFSWHFSHVNGGHLMPPTVVPFSLFTEGHVGVALFMCLSGYLFAKLLDGRTIVFSAFFWNRIIRLFPLLFCVFAFEGAIRWLSGQSMQPFFATLLQGFVLPVWPNGGWSIAVELHFYLILPLLLFISSIRPQLILLVVLASVLGRYLYWKEMGEVQSLAYWTIVGGIDQFVFGIFAFHFRDWMRGKHMLAVAIASAFLYFNFQFDAFGGFYKNEGYPTQNPIWIFYPAIVGAAFAFLIAWYDGSFKPRSVGVSGLFAKVGACSYSIYLLHAFFVFDVAKYIDKNLVELTDPVTTTGISFLVFLAFVPIAYVSFQKIEIPPMVWKVPYQKIPSAKLVERDLI